MKVVISARRIRAMREELDCTQEQFGALIGRSWTTVARWESSGGIKGRVPATGKKRESMLMLGNLSAIAGYMVEEKMKLELRKEFLLAKNKELQDFAPITLVCCSGCGLGMLQKLHELIAAIAKL